MPGYNVTKIPPPAAPKPRRRALLALAIAAQACLPVLHLGLHWYDDFRGIVVHPSAMRAQRVVQDEMGLVHHYTEELSGEAMDGGPRIIEAECIKYENVFPMIPAGAALEDMLTEAPKHKMEKPTGST
jgi:hypothetical protein